VRVSVGVDEVAGWWPPSHNSQFICVIYRFFSSIFLSFHPWRAAL
jgi:hypothetical protein